jgi:acetoin:2,6-dichlorophenolindophenol oxidoreductase subunit alpha
MNLENLYRQMSRIRAFELVLADLWRQGLISGEMHLGTGEEAVIAGVVAHLKNSDAMSIDHRSTPPLVARGVDLTSMILEQLGSPEGLCGGMGGHMHMFSKDHLAASSGITGSSVPIGAGFAMAAQLLRPGAIAVAFLGEGSMNQGMAMEALNLAAAWKLPLVVVCKDSRWAITTRSAAVTGGRMVARAKALGVPGVKVDGLRVDKVHKAAARMVARARRGAGPGFIHATCVHMDGHFLKDPLLRLFTEPVEQVRQISGPLIKATLKRPGAAPAGRFASLCGIGQTCVGLGLDTYGRRDPLTVNRCLVGKEVWERLDDEAREEVDAAARRALEIAKARS